MHFIRKIVDIVAIIFYLFWLEYNELSQSEWQMIC